jgi:hypothetical protein
MHLQGFPQLRFQQRFLQLHRHNNPLVNLLAVQLNLQLNQVPNHLGNHLMLPLVHLAANQLHIPQYHQQVNLVVSQVDIQPICHHPNVQNNLLVNQHANRQKNLHFCRHSNRRISLQTSPLVILLQGLQGILAVNLPASQLCSLLSNRLLHIRQGGQQEFLL